MSRRWQHIVFSPCCGSGSLDLGWSWTRIYFAANSGSESLDYGWTRTDFAANSGSGSLDLGWSWTRIDIAANSRSGSGIQYLSITELDPVKFLHLFSVILSDPIKITAPSESGNKTLAS